MHPATTTVPPTAHDHLTLTRKPAVSGNGLPASFVRNKGGQSVTISGTTIQNRKGRCRVHEKKSRNPEESPVSGGFQSRPDFAMDGLRTRRVRGSALYFGCSWLVPSAALCRTFRVVFLTSTAEAYRSVVLALPVAPGNYPDGAAAPAGQTGFDLP